MSILLVKERQPYDWVVLSPAKAGSSLRLTLPKGVLARGGPVDVARQGGKPSEVARPVPEQELDNQGQVGGRPDHRGGRGRRSLAGLCRRPGERVLFMGQSAN